MTLLNLIIEKWKNKQITNNPDPIYIQLREVIKNIIYHRKNGFNETYLPPTRTLANSLELSRSTILKTYELLILDKIISSKKGSAYYINTINSSNILLKNTSKKANYPKFSNRGETLNSNQNQENKILDTNIAFRPGLPPLDIFPIKQWTKLYNAYWKNVKASQLNYSNVSGVNDLKINIANYLYYTRGINSNYEQIVIVSCSLQSLFLIGTALVNKGDEVIVEDPTFPNVHSTFKNLQAKLQAVEIDNEGIMVNKFNKKSSPKIIHTTPSCQYPFGVQMTINRKKELLSWAQKKSAVIIENDYDHDVNNFGLNNPSLFKLDKDDRVIYLGTFNRILHPSIRMGYMIVPYFLLNVIEEIQKYSHQFVSPTNQFVMSEFIRRNYLIQHIKNVVEAEEERRNLMINYLKDKIDDSFKIQNFDTKSLHLLAKIPKEISDFDVIKKLRQNKINVESLSRLSLNNQITQGLILGHTAVNKHMMNTKLNDLITTYNSTIKKSEN